LSEVVPQFLYLCGGVKSYHADRHSKSPRGRHQNHKRFNPLSLCSDTRPFASPQRTAAIVLPSSGNPRSTLNHSKSILSNVQSLNRALYSMDASTLTLNTGYPIPSIGLGTWQAQPKELEEVPLPIPHRPPCPSNHGSWIILTLGIDIRD
jgi:hypothetical protein